MNHFGTRRWRGEPGKSGERGPPGLSGIDILCQIFWPQMNRWLQDNQMVSYYFDTETSGWIIENDKIVAIKNQINNEWNGYLFSGEKYGKLVREFNRYFLQFDKEIYRIGDKVFPFGRPMYKTLIILNFKRPDTPDKEVLITDKHGYRQVYLYKGEVYFACDAQIMKFRYFPGRWNTVFLELNDNRHMKSFFSVNIYQVNAFNIGGPATDGFFYIGGWKGDNFFKGQIGRIDIYHKLMDDQEIFPRDILTKYIYSNFQYK